MHPSPIYWNCSRACLRLVLLNWKFFLFLSDFCYCTWQFFQYCLLGLKYTPHATNYIYQEGTAAAAPVFSFYQQNVCKTQSLTISHEQNETLQVAIPMPRWSAKMYVCTKNIKYNQKTSSFLYFHNLLKTYKLWASLGNFSPSFVSVEETHHK